MYVIGLPLSGLALLYKFRNKLDQPRTRVRFGTLYDGFSREHYMHEGWVALRKFLLIVIGIFYQQVTSHSSTRRGWYFISTYRMESTV